MENNKRFEDELSTLRTRNAEIESEVERLRKAAQRLVDRAKNADQELWASLPDVIALRDALERKEE